MRAFAIVILSQLLISGAQAQSLTGRYVGRTESGAIVLTLRHEPNGTVTGSLLEDGVTTPLSGHADRGGSRLTAAMQVEGQQWTFSGELRGSTLTLSVRGATLTLTRAGAGDEAVPPPAAPGETRNLPAAAPPAPPRHPRPRGAVVVAPRRGGLGGRGIPRERCRRSRHSHGRRAPGRCLPRHQRRVRQRTRAHPVGSGLSSAAGPGSAGPRLAGRAGQFRARGRSGDREPVSPGAESIGAPAGRPEYLGPHRRGGLSDPVALRAPTQGGGVAVRRQPEDDVQGFSPFTAATIPPTSTGSVSSRRYSSGSYRFPQNPPAPSDPHPPPGDPPPANVDPATPGSPHDPRGFVLIDPAPRQDHD